ERRHTYRTGEPALPWVYASARHIRVDHDRKALRVAIRERQVDAMPEAAAEPRAQIGARIGAEHGAGAGGSAGRGPDLAALLSELPRSQREVIAMLKISGMSLEEVARATSCSIGSVKQKAHRAYEKLRRVLIELGFGPVGDKTAAGGGPKKDAAKDRGARD